MSYMDTTDDAGGYSHRGGGRGGGYKNYRDDYRDNYRGGRSYYRGGRGGRSDNYRGGRDDYYDRGSRWGHDDRTRGYSNRNSWGRGRGRSSRGGRYNDYYDDRGGRDRGQYRPPNREYFPFTVLTNLDGHEQAVTALVLDEAQKKIYSGSRDGTLRIWNLDGQCESVLQTGGSVTCLFMEGGFLFAAILPAANAPGIIRVWSMASGAQMDLNGHESEVLCMTATNGVLISGGRDTTIRVWAFDQQSQIFKETGMFQGGHNCAVQCLVVERQYLISGDWQGKVKVWDTGSMSAIQTLNAHDNVIMNMLVYQNQYLLTASLDGSIKVFQLSDTVLPGQFFEKQAEYSHPPQEDRRNAEQYGGVLAMVGTTNSEGEHVLAVSHDQEGLIRLWSIPHFDEKGQAKVRDCRAIAVGMGLVVVGHGRGQIKVFQWK